MNRPRLARPAPFVVLLAVSAFVASARADAPAGRYTVTADRVFDTKTKLTWERVPLHDEHTLVDAKNHCSGLTIDGGGFRLPSLKELQTIFDPRRKDPAIDPIAFPNTPIGYFWTSTPNVQFPTQMWISSSSDGSVSTALDGASSHVRCVR